MPRWMASLLRIYGWLLKYRWLFVLCLALIAIFWDFDEHDLIENFHLTPDISWELFYKGLFLPVLIGVLLTLLFRLTNDRYLLLQFQAHKSELLRQVNNAPTLADLIKVIVELPRSVAPVTGADLVIYDSDLDPGETRISWSLEGGFSFSPPPRGSVELCTACANRALTPGPTACQFEHPDYSTTRLNRICVPLEHAHLLVGTLFLFLPPDVPLSNQQRNLFSSLAPEMALALDAARNRRLNILLKGKAEVERRKLTRSLHDNLAHGLIYVRNQLEVWTGMETGAVPPGLAQDLNKLHDTVEELYLDLRSTLKELEANPSTDLTQDLEAYLQSIQPRVGYQIQYASRGQPQPVPTQLALHTIYILREVLSNIEKHSGANWVAVDLNWRNDGFLLSIKDNGQGFDPKASTNNGHMGLKIIQERAEEIKGRLVVKSTRGSGTEVTLWLPITSVPVAV